MVTKDERPATESHGLMNYAGALVAIKCANTALMEAASCTSRGVETERDAATAELQRLAHRALTQATIAALGLGVDVDLAVQHGREVLDEVLGDENAEGEVLGA